MTKNKPELTKAQKEQLIALVQQQEEDKRLLAKLRDNFANARSEYSKAHRRMRKLDAIDNGDLWKIMGAKYPKYQILPDTNHVAYIKNNILASIFILPSKLNVSSSVKYTLNTPF